MAAFQLPPLPYATDALAPHISKETLEFHHGKHHAAYVNTLNSLIGGTDLAGRPLEDIIRSADPGPVLNNAAQMWNHEFYWRCMAPNGGGEPGGELQEAIARDFGSFDAFKGRFSESCVSHFGSGWVWLAADGGGKLHIFQGHDAGNPLRDGLKPLLVTDLWEHAYYIDYRNARGKYLEGWWQLVNWPFAAENLRRAAGA